LQRRDAVSSVTTDMSLQASWNQVLVALTLVGFGAVLALALIAKAFKAEDVPVGALVGPPSSEPALEPMGRATFGKRRA
jgi:hypothetical protein